MEVNNVHSPMLALGLLSMLMQNTSSPTESAQTTSHGPICDTNSPMTSNLSMGDRAFCCQWPMFLLVDLTVSAVYFSRCWGNVTLFLHLPFWRDATRSESLSGPNDTLWFAPQQSDVWSYKSLMFSVSLNFLGHKHFSPQGPWEGETESMHYHLYTI